MKRRQIMIGRCPIDARAKLGFGLLARLPSRTGKPGGSRARALWSLECLVASLHDQLNRPYGQKHLFSGRFSLAEYIFIVRQKALTGNHACSAGFMWRSSECCTKRRSRMK
jgi:hypothetical protein